MKYEYYKLKDSEICIPIAENYKDCIKLVKSDEYRKNGRETSFLLILFKKMKPFSNSFLFWFRMSSYKGLFFPLCKFFYRLSSRKFNIDIPLETKIGFGLYMGHETCMVINGKTIIGNNVNLSQFLNIGSNHETPAKIGDNVYIGPNVCVL